MSDQRYSEKEEEKQEKEVEKTEEKSAEEKNWDEKWRRDPVNAAAWAAIFIWAGLVFLIDNLGILQRILVQFGGTTISKAVSPWGLVLVGAGVIIIIAAVVRLVIPEHRRPVFGSFLLGILLIGVGLGELFTWNIIWPLLLIALGVSILARGFIKRN
ncbi:MAG: hypothetical protein GYA34_10315 [Chloroflexi bacterium]|nr:hypothetical protein [Chloroflexota bacterium]